MERRSKDRPKATHQAYDQYEMWTFPLLRDIPEIEYVGHQQFRKATHLPDHAHAGALEICFLEKGEVVWWSGSDTCELTGGHAFISWPDELHGNADHVLNPCKLYWLCLTFPRKAPKGYLGLPAKEGAALHEGLRTLDRRSFPVDAWLPRCFDRIFASLATMPSPLATAAVRSDLVGILGEVIRAGKVADPDGVRTTMVAEAIRMMDENRDPPLSVAELSRRLGWSENHFRSRFRIETGMTPNEFYLRRRVGLARELIERSKQSLTMIALELGFGSSQYMSTCFRRVTGRTPSSFRAAAKGRRGQSRKR